LDENLKEITQVGVYAGEETLSGPMKDLHRKTHQTIKKVTNDVEDRFHFNTAISAVMELVNGTNKCLSSDGVKGELPWSVVREAVETVVLLLSPVVPHMTEEMWRMLGHEASLLEVSWPSYRTDALDVEKRLIVLQVNGKVRSRIEVPASLGDKEVEAEALKDERIQRFIGDKTIKRVIVVPNKLVNIVV
jgi:leucyl-tRNA synthetase